MLLRKTGPIIAAAALLLAGCGEPAGTERTEPTAPVAPTLGPDDVVNSTTIDPGTDDDAPAVEPAPTTSTITSPPGPPHKADLPSPSPVCGAAQAFQHMASVFGECEDEFRRQYSEREVQLLGLGAGDDPFVDYVLAYAKTTRVSDEFVDADEGNDLFVVGDSYAGDVMNALLEGGYFEGLEVLSHKISWDCHNVPVTSGFEEFIEPENVDECREAVRVGDPALSGRLGEAELVLVASAWTEYATGEMPELLEAIEAETDAPVLIVGRKHFGKMEIEELFDYSEEDFVEVTQTSAFHVELIKAVPEEVRGNYLDLHRLFCGDSDSCPIATPEGALISYDGGHLTREGAIHLSNLLGADEDFMRLWGDVFGDCTEPGPCPTN